MRLMVGRLSSLLMRTGEPQSLWHKTDGRESLPGRASGLLNAFGMQKRTIDYDRARNIETVCGSKRLLGTK